MKATEQEVIEIDLSEGMRTYLVENLKETMKGLSRKDRRHIPQYKFLISVMKKCETPTDFPMLFSARECATLGGWLAAVIEIDTPKSRVDLVTEIQQVVSNVLSQWEERMNR